MLQSVWEFCSNFVNNVVFGAAEMLQKLRREGGAVIRAVTDAIAARDPLRAAGAVLWAAIWGTFVLVLAPFMVPSLVLHSLGLRDRFVDVATYVGGVTIATSIAFAVGGFILPTLAALTAGFGLGIFIL